MIIGAKCLEQALAHTEWNVSVAIVLLLYLKGLPCDHIWDGVPRKASERKPM